jgi:NADH-ubiquinone oxidoreductase chain 6
MENLFMIFETYTNGYRTEVLDVISLLAILSGILVIISKNPVISVLFLIGLFASISSYLLMIGLSFLGLSYLIVYIGAVSILFLFILMLINIRISELQSDTNNSIPLAIAIAISFNYPLFQILPYNVAILNNSNFAGTGILNNILYNISGGNFATTQALGYGDKATPFLKGQSYNDDIYFVTSKIWDGSLIENTHITSIGNIMYTNFSMWLIITGFILLLAMVGAIVITIKQKN